MMSRLSSSKSGMPLSRLLRRARRDRSGATAVEFALIAAPFFFLLFAMIEIAAVFFTSTVLENAVLETGREIRTGQAQAAGMTSGGFQNEICRRIEVVGNCDRLEFDVRVFSGFDTVDQTSPVQEDGSLNSASFGWDPGGAGDIVLVRVFYRWSLLTPNFGGALSNMSGNQRLLTAATVFRNEPFND
ncbi:TadE/TadG family type IV pilus assembly protein [uncultured Maricaulis sp.]|uniref:TadE/TadG family type IV pilus assembly protein n=1 Tax=uncultured Maricaulis sp. TaxID=174710 RepID=UPI0030DD2C98|tara:strand:- start:238365 stop:238925 length:561 start_codon:yes stop_codon:yes gene_type:complete